MKWVLLIALSVSYVLDQHVQDADVAQLDSGDEPIWLDPDAPAGLLLHRVPAVGVERGAVLILAATDAGPNANTHAVRARLQLPFHGWHTYFARIPHAASAGIVAAPSAMLGYTELIRGSSPGPLIIIAEGQLGESCVMALATLGVDGVVLINLPTQGVPRDLLEAVELPTLVLQVSPNRWPKEHRLGADVELHLLSGVDARRQDNRLLRKIRGWFKRRFDAA
jgi:hypothetical protein